MEEVRPMKRVKSPDVLVRKKKAPKRNMSNMVTLNARPSNVNIKASPAPAKPKKSRIKKRSGFGLFNEFTIKKQSKVQKLDKMMKKVTYQFSDFLQLTVKFKSKMTFDEKVIAG